MPPSFSLQTYVFWNAHETYLEQVRRHACVVEPSRRRVACPMRQVDNASWAGRANLPAFIQAAAARGLWVSVRIGPYICGEYYFGGIPVRARGARASGGSRLVWNPDSGRASSLRTAMPSKWMLRSALRSPRGPRPPCVRKLSTCTPRATSYRLRSLNELFCVRSHPLDPPA